VKVRYTRRALRQMTEILDYIEARSPNGADNVKRRLQGIIDLLADHPNSGRTTNKGDLRRFVVNPYLM
jgi:toxin ParE1/3/4